MHPPRAVIFDLGGTLIDWPDWTEDVRRRWGMAYDYLIAQLPHNGWPEKDVYVQAMQEAEESHWQQVREQQWIRTSYLLKRITADGRRDS